uniref:C-type lectin domain-containing protein n=1 Tax=Myripristis murdjan TaxID=586833 RepID=A0A668AQ37_9TELE
MLSIYRYILLIYICSCIFTYCSPSTAARIPPTVPSRFCQRCPENWMEINSRCYFLSRESKSWKESREDCQSKDADLVIISSEQEQVQCSSFKGLQCSNKKWHRHGVNIFGKLLTFTIMPDGKPIGGATN